MTRRDDEREMEMARGRQIAGRAARCEDLDRYVAGKKVKVMVALHGHRLYEHHGRVNLFYVDDVLIGHQNTDADDYPSEAVMATIALAVGATVGFENIPDVIPTHNVSAESKEYNRRLQEANSTRLDFK